MRLLSLLEFWGDPNAMRLAEPAWLAALVLVPLPWLLARARGGVRWPTLGGFARGPRGWARGAGLLSGLLRGAAIGGLVMALARPQEVGGRIRIAGRGVAIVVALDHSSSMDEADFPSEGGPIARLEAARRTIDQFVAGRPDDLLGLVVFANYPDLACPPTLDHEALREALGRVETARPGDDGTNLGDAIAWSLEALRSSTPARKVLVLLTDGRNAPAVPHPLPPLAAADLARDLGVTLHAIAVGDPGGPPREVDPDSGLPLGPPGDGPDLQLLASLARLGGGRSFHAADADALDRIFRALDVLETSPIRGTIRTRYRERFAPWAGLALALLIVDRLLADGRLRRLP